MSEECYLLLSDATDSHWAGSILLLVVELSPPLQELASTWLVACCRIRLDTKEPRDSDKYNGSLLESPVHSSKSSQSLGYGLGSSAFSQFGGLNGVESRGLGTSYSPARSSYSEEVLGSQESTNSTAFLEPFGGADNVKIYPPPSPLKPQPAHDVGTTENSCTSVQACCCHVKHSCCNSCD